MTGPRTMRFPEVREARRAMLGLPHIKPLTDFVRRLRATYDAEFPDFDPADGGTKAEIIFLFEKPGPMTSSARQGRSGSGFISRDNDDPTAEATFNFMIQAGIPREKAVLWNLIPGWNGVVNVTKDELRLGALEVENLLSLTPHAKSIVLVGRKAQRAEHLLQGHGLKIFRSPHPSQRVKNSRNRDQWMAIPRYWAEAATATWGSQFKALEPR
jgi:hypothetical protein